MNDISSLIITLSPVANLPSLIETSILLSIE